MGFVALLEKKGISLSPPFCTARIQGEKPFAGQAESSPRNWIGWHLDLLVSSLENCKEINFCSEAPQLVMFCYGSPS